MIEKLTREVVVGFHARCRQCLTSGPVADTAEEAKAKAESAGWELTSAAVGRVDAYDYCPRCILERARR